MEINRAYLTAKTYNLLIKHNVKTEQDIEALGAYGLLGFKGIGRQTLKELERSLKIKLRPFAYCTRCKEYHDSADLSHQEHS